MKKLISSISMHIKAIEEQGVNIEDLDFLVTQCNLLQEQLIILRYKVYEEVSAKNNGEKKCKVCGYKNHVEVCHIKSVSSFGDNDLITEINSFNNLIGLCPNHHWEFDNGHVKL